MAIGKHVGSKIDRHGSTFADRHDAIKSASKLASQSVKASAFDAAFRKASGDRMARPKDDRKK